jgi:hypothetical protein
MIRLPWLVRTTLLTVPLLAMAGCQPARVEPSALQGPETIPAAPAEPDIQQVQAEEVRRRDDGQGQVQERPWDFHGVEGRVIETDHFRLHTTLQSRRMLNRLPAFYEGALEQYTTALGDLPLPTRRLDSYIFRDDRQWKNKTREVLPDQADIFMTLGRGGFTTEGTSVLYFIGPRDTFAIAAHEGWHQYTQGTFRHHLPIWLEEGIATYMEAIWFDRDGTTHLRPSSNGERRYALRSAVREEQLIPLDELLARTPQSFLSNGKNQLLVYYAQVWGLVRFLTEADGGKHRPALEQLLQDAAHGRLVGKVLRSNRSGITRRRRALDEIRTGPAVMRTYFGADLDEIGREYEQFIMRISRRRSRS